MEGEDDRLIRFLAKHDHWTPFAHPQAQFRVTAPIYIANQLKRHQDRVRAQRGLEALHRHGADVRGHRRVARQADRWRQARKQRERLTKSDCQILHENWRRPPGRVTAVESFTRSFWPLASLRSRRAPFSRSPCTPRGTGPGASTPGLACAASDSIRMRRKRTESSPR